MPSFTAGQNLTKIQAPARIIIVYDELDVEPTASSKRWAQKPTGYPVSRLPAAVNVKMLCLKLN